MIIKISIEIYENERIYDDDNDKKKIVKHRISEVSLKCNDANILLH